MDLNVINKPLFIKDDFKGKKVSFKGPADVIVKVLSSPAATKTVEIVNSESTGPAVVDVAAMVGPRSLSDTIDKNPIAGTETFAREISATGLNCYSPGLIALGLTAAAQKPLLNKTVLIDNATLDHFADIWKDTISCGDKHTRVNKFVDEIFSGTDVNNNGSKTKIDINSDSIKPKINSLKKLITDEKELNKKELKKQLEEIIHTISNSQRGNRTNYILNADKGAHGTTLDLLVDQTYKTGRHIFLNENIDLTNVLKRISSNNKIKIPLSLGIVGTIGYFSQPINRYLTTLRTGQKGFVGYKPEDQTDEIRPKPPLPLKLAAASGIILIALTSMGVLSRKGLNVKGLADKLQFNSMFPNNNHLRVVYSAMITGRLMGSDDNNELLETACRDYTGFMNWLVLGGFVTKLTGYALNKVKLGSGDIKLPIINLTEDISNVNGFFKKLGKIITKTSIKSIAEIEDAALKGNGNTIDKSITNAINSAKAKSAISVAAGFAYSLLALGLVMPKVNTVMTHRREQAKKEKTDRNRYESLANKVLDKTTELNKPQSSDPKAVLASMGFKIKA